MHTQILCQSSEKFSNHIFLVFATQLHEKWPRDIPEETRHHIKREMLPNILPLVDHPLVDQHTGPAHATTDETIHPYHRLQRNKVKDCTRKPSAAPRWRYLPQTLSSTHPRRAWPRSRKSKYDAWPEMHTEHRRQSDRASHKRVRRTARLATNDHRTQTYEEGTHPEGLPSRGETARTKDGRIRPRRQWIRDARDLNKPHGASSGDNAGCLINPRTSSRSWSTRKPRGLQAISSVRTRVSMSSCLCLFLDVESSVVRGISLFTSVDTLSTGRFLLLVGAGDNIC